MQHLAPFVVKELKARGYTVAQYPVQFAQDTASIDYVTVKTQKAREFKNGLPSGDRDRVLYLSLHSDASKATFGLKGDDCVGHMSIIPQCHDNKAAAIGKAMAEAIIKTAGYKASKTTKVSTKTAWLHRQSAMASHKISLSFKCIGAIRISVLRQLHHH